MLAGQIDPPRSPFHHRIGNGSNARVDSTRVLLTDAQGDGPQERRTRLLLRGHKQERLIFHDCFSGCFRFLFRSSADIQTSIRFFDIGLLPVSTRKRTLKVAFKVSLRGRPNPLYYARRAQNLAHPPKFSSLSGPIYSRKESINSFHPIVKFS